MEIAFSVYSQKWLFSVSLLDYARKTLGFFEVLIDEDRQSSPHGVKSATSRKTGETQNNLRRTDRIEWKRTFEAAEAGDRDQELQHHTAGQRGPPKVLLE